MTLLSDLSVYIKKYPNNVKKILDYGTAGFRDKACYLPHVAFRVGILAGLRANFKKAIIGVMITASHNPEEDNGVKIIEPNGSMLEQSWEKLATDLANVQDSDLEKHVMMIIEHKNIDVKNPSKVFIARDTRKSSPLLSEALIDGIKVSNAELVDFGLLTTPILHFIVRCANFNDYGTQSEEGYYEKLGNAFSNLTKQFTNQVNLVVDCANGVGALKLKKFQSFLNKQKLNMELVNVGDGILNYECGADYVKTNQRPPKSLDLKENFHYASFDGDGDRIIFYYKNSQDKQFHMLDGDKIAALVAMYLKKTLQEAGLGHLGITVVQTAYANGSSTRYLQNTLGLSVECVPTGVKHLHHRAEQSPIGIYFEANGHGTILFSKEAEQQIEKCENESAKNLLNFIDLVNQTVGDSISDMLIVETILASLNLKIEDWDSFYNEVPNKLLKLTVKDRRVIKTIDSERKCVDPPGLQEQIDKKIKKFGSMARAFIRPSGTEDVVRIYAEAETAQLVDKLAKSVANLVYDFANGVGQKFEL